MKTIAELLTILVTSSLINNVVLSQFLGLCPFLGVSKKTDTGKTIPYKSCVHQ